MDPDKPSLYERISSFLLREPEDREQLLQLLQSAHERQLLDAEALSIIQGAIATSEMRVHEAMVPRARMQVIDVDDPFPEIVARINRSGHSRFPVIEGERDNVLGIVLAKDLLRVTDEQHFRLRDWLRPAVFIPESKQLSLLLREFRVSRNHMAIVIDEYAGVSGLITIEDVLEQIVGDIEDEYDFDEDAGNIRRDSSGALRVKAQTPVEDLAETLGTHFADEECDTVGGLILNALGRVPRRNESVEIDGVRFLVLRADNRRLYTVLASPLPAAETRD